MKTIPGQMSQKAKMCRSIHVRGKGEGAGMFNVTQFVGASAIQSYLHVGTYAVTPCAFLL